MEDNKEIIFLNKKSTLDIPEGSVAILISIANANDVETAADFKIFHNFVHAAMEQTEHERLLYAIAQGIMSICTYEPMRVVSAGIEAIRKFFVGRGLDFGAVTGLDSYDVAHAEPKGTA